MRARELWIVSLVALLVAVVLTWPLVTDMTGRLPHDPRFTSFAASDTNIWVWNFWWARRVVEGGGDPFYCDAIFPPVGHSLAFHTHTFLWGVVSVPLQWIGGLFFAVNAMVPLLLASAAVAAWALARTLGLGLTASGVAGFAWGFSPYFLQKGLVHFNLGASPWMPLVLVFLLRWMNTGERGRAWPFALGVGVTVALSLLTGSLQTVYLLASAAVLVLLAPPRVHARQEGDGRRRRSPRLPLLRPWPVLVAVVALWITAQPFLSAWIEERAKGAFEGFPQEFHPELYDFFTASGLHPMFEGLGAAEPIEGSPFEGKRPEHAALTLRLSLLALAAAGLVLVPGSRRWAVGFALLFLLAWDPGPEPEGVLSGLYRSLPPLDHLRVPARFLPAALLYLSMVAACGVQALLARPKGRVVALGLLGGLGFESWIGPYPGHPVHVPVVVRELARRPREGVVLTLPFEPGANVSMLWQTQHGFPVVTSYLARIQPSAATTLEVSAPDLVRLALGLDLDPSPAALAVDLGNLDVRHVLVRDDGMLEPERLHRVLDDLHGWERYPDPGDGVQWWYETGW